MEKNMENDMETVGIYGFCRAPCNSPLTRFSCTQALGIDKWGFPKARARDMEMLLIVRVPLNKYIRVSQNLGFHFGCPHDKDSNICRYRMRAI